ncbi:MAG: TrkA family potassium uptake protein [Anaerolineales bacterium]|nr:MAG: TrkA family potassium uptake protein [Anaerolineales bacterium]
MFVIIYGGGRVGAHLATLLYELGHRVRLIENREDVIEKLHQELPTEMIYVGDALDPRILEEAGIREANVFVSASPEDSANLSVAYLAKKKFNVARVIGRVNNPRYAWLFTPEMGVDIALNQADILARLIEEEMSLGDMMPLLKLRRGEYMLVEEKVPEGAPAIGIMIKDLDLPDHCVIAAIIRDGVVVVPRGIIALEPGDEVLAVVDRPAANHLAELFSANRPPDAAKPEDQV